ncbi:unnamed protein product [Prorocentrum cordatum]|uniref:Cation/H+ exchanger transmembrane domain-containing protein n=1 Tax=Prorocentrum cordatum TaxID=2364126 RepID=A0ABN9T5D5_9DINO|nr:unnamed protein product [Polarella glacialis]
MSAAVAASPVERTAAAKDELAVQEAVAAASKASKAPLCPCRLVIFCCNLFVGLIGSQLIPEWMDASTYGTWKAVVKVVTMFCVSYIMMHVGFEFDVDTSRLSQYGREYLIAMSAAGIPWICCAVYFMYALGQFGLPWQQALIAARFAAPTSAGILFTMLEAAGMKETWIFQKVRILAIFDDLDTLLLMVPLKAIYIGPKWELVVELVFVAILCILMARFMHKLTVPISWPYLCLYAAGVTVVCEMVHFLTSSQAVDPNNVADTIHLEVLLPAFTVGCIIKHENAEHDGHELQRPDSLSLRCLCSPGNTVASDTVKMCISAVFMVLVGFSMPPLFSSSLEDDGHRRLGSDETMAPHLIVIHVIACSFLMILGKMFPAACYKSEVNLQTRVALAVAMMPRGEVSAGIIANALALGISGPPMVIAIFCLALNMMMVSVFIFTVKTLAKEKATVTDSQADEGVPAVCSVGGAEHAAVPACGPSPAALEI